jgi:hypothetical protein
LTYTSKSLRFFDVIESGGSILISPSSQRCALAY